MRKNKHLYTFKRVNALLLLWCLFVTTLLNVKTVLAEEAEFFYDSSIQRSNFITIKPRYEKLLEKEIKARRATLFWRLRFDSQSLETDNNIQSQSVGATIRTKFKYRIIENLSFKAKTNLSLESGRSQDIFGDLEPASGIYPRQLKLQWDAFSDHLELNFGQIHQRWLNEGLFIGNLGFPGLQEKVKYGNKRFDIHFTAQQLIPTSSTLSTRVSEREEMPNFFTETIAARYTISSHNFIRASGTAFRYTNLPSTVAYESFIYGNSVTAPDRNSGQFVYDFGGWMSQVSFEQKISNSLAGQVQWHTIKNTKAPDFAGEAQSVRVTVVNDFGRWILGGAVKNYFIESDAVPAFYNSHILGHNNRIGNSYKLILESKDWGVIFRGSYTRANLLNPSMKRTDGLQQDNQQTIYFSVETIYDFI